MKKKKMEKTVKLLEAVKLHSGPVTPNSLGFLDTLNEKQLLEEVKYLRAIAPDIRQMRRTKTTDGRFKMLTFSDNELNKRAQRALGRSSEEKVKGHSGDNNREP